MCQICDITTNTRKYLQICGLELYQGIYLLYTRYPIVARALGLAFRPSARASKGILHTNISVDPNIQFSPDSKIVGSPDICLGTNPNHIFGEIFLCL